MSNNNKKKMGVSEASWRIRRHVEETREKHRGFFERGKKVIGHMGSLGKSAIKQTGAVVREVAKQSRPYVKEGSRYSARVSSQMRTSPLFAGGRGWGSFDSPPRKPKKRGGSRTITIRVVGGQVKKRSKKKRKTQQYSGPLF